MENENKGTYILLEDSESNETKDEHANNIAFDWFPLNEITEDELQNRNILMLAFRQ